MNVPPDARMPTSGVVPDSLQQMLPTIEFCGKASEESRSAADALRWQAFRQLDQSEQDPIDMAAGDRVGHMIFVQEFLRSGDPAEIETAFNALRDGLQACQASAGSSPQLLRRSHRRPRAHRKWCGRGPLEHKG